jgi:membrane-associated phospholipid phosphatase
MPAIYAFDAFPLIQAMLVTPLLDFPMALLSTACEGWALVLIALAVAWAMERRAVETFRAVVPVLVTLLASGLVAQLVKRLVQLPRPLSVLGPSRVHLVLEPLGQLSFPSGHATAVAGLAMALTLRYGGQVSWVWAFAFLGGLSRIYVGAHWAADVGAGWAIGMASGLLVTVLLRLPFRNAVGGRASAQSLAAAQGRPVGSTPEAA